MVLLHSVRSTQGEIQQDVDAFGIEQTVEDSTRCFSMQRVAQWEIFLSHLAEWFQTSGRPVQSVRLSLSPSLGLFQLQNVR